MRHKTPKTSSIEKALMVLMAFTSHYDEMGTVELSQKLGFHPATATHDISAHLFHQKLMANRS